MSAFTMPSLGADMDEGVLREWLVGPGDPVRRGDVVAIVETDKAAIEVECFESGTVGRLLVPPGTRVPVGTPLAEIEHGREPAGPARKDTLKPGTRARPAGPEPGKESAGRAANAVDSPARPAPEPSGEAACAGAGPLVRHLAQLRGVDLTALSGTGPGGRITRADVEHAPSPRAPRVRATPYARRLARDLGIDLTAVRGTGDGGAVRGVDVRTAAQGADVRAGAQADAAARPAEFRRESEQRTPPAAPAEEHPGRRTDTMRRAIAELMSRSKREIPHYYLATTIDLTAGQTWLRRINRGRPPADRLVPAALLMKAAALAAREVPALNGYWRDEGFVPGTEINVGVAVSLRQGGLLSPVIHRADTLAPETLMAHLKDLVERARRGRLRGSETTGATLTVTNLGEQGVESVFGVIHPPQVALVGFGAVVERPWARNGMLGVCPVVTVTLAADHRATDGAVGARYLTAVDRLLQRPEEL
ncbi:2-oxo acid dehydrogenase subunit E2 [Streptomyces naganishii]|uniref:Dihydrolipoamide acetyltransferase component of pyruvate dehydrogenase complex n=1 Tax=Streptomyces naganishii JCM 4654 TaxID=1306179 RepID=A0A918Y7L4_9ACTN|nr:2-oxo acid dehydrogenase subunit E2 [Streptomyces naganishii]GHD91884.1 acetyltransferase component of pyruvate dehydrogenase complex [Streptomyces naganishii JCM 4654]